MSKVAATPAGRVWTYWPDELHWATPWPAGGEPVSVIRDPEMSVALFVWTAASSAVAFTKVAEPLVILAQDQSFALGNVSNASVPLPNGPTEMTANALVATK